MDNNVPLHIKLFNERVRAMNQSNGKIVTLNAQEARSLHAEIYDLMAIIAGSARTQDTTTNSININMDGGKFK